jgi:hypothetical protein
MIGEHHAARGGLSCASTSIFVCWDETGPKCRAYAARP